MFGVGKLGRSYGRMGSRGGGVALDVATIVISSSFISENSSVGDLIGSLSVVNGSGSYTFTLLDDGGGKAALDLTNNEDVEVAGAIDYETTTSFSITVEADNGVDLPIQRIFPISVIDVFDDALVSFSAASAASDTTPDLDIELPVGAQAGDVIHVEISDAGADDWVDYFIHTLVDASSDVTIYGLTELTEGSYDFRARIERGGVGPWSATLTIAVNFAPTLASSVPTDDATDVSVSANITLTFNKNVQFGTGVIALYTAADVLVYEWDVAVDVGTDPGEVSITDDTVTCVLPSNLAGGTGHYLQVDATAIENVDGVPFAGIADETTLSFTTVSGTAFPVVEARATTAVDIITTTPTINLPASIQSGDLLIIISCSPGATNNAPSGFSEVASHTDVSAPYKVAVFSKVASGSEGATIAGDTTSGRSTHVAYRISGAGSVEALFSADDSADPPSLAPVGGSQKYLWLTAYISRRSDWTMAAAPTNYTDMQTAKNASSTATSRSGVISAERTNEASSEDPAAWSPSGTTDNPCSVTISVEPA